MGEMENGDRGEREKSEPGIGSYRTNEESVPFEEWVVAVGGIIGVKHEGPEGM